MRSHGQAVGWYAGVLWETAANVPYLDSLPVFTFDLRQGGVIKPQAGT